MQDRLSLKNNCSSFRPPKGFGCRAEGFSQGSPRGLGLRVYIWVLDLCEISGEACPANAFRAGLGPYREKDFNGFRIWHELFRELGALIGSFGVRNGDGCETFKVQRSSVLVAAAPPSTDYSFFRLRRLVTSDCHYDHQLALLLNSYNNNNYYCYYYY